MFIEESVDLLFVGQAKDCKGQTRTKRQDKRDKVAATGQQGPYSRNDDPRSRMREILAVSF